MASAQPPGTPALGTGHRVRKPRPGGGSRDSQRDHRHAGEEDASPRRPRARTQKWGRAGGNACCSLELPSACGGRGAGSCAGARLLWFPLVSLDALGSCHPLSTQRGQGLQSQQGPNAQLGWEAHGHTVARDTGPALARPQSPGGKPAHRPWDSNEGHPRCCPIITPPPHPGRATAACEEDPQSRTITGSLPAPPPTKCPSFSKSLLLSEPRFPHLENETKHIPSLVPVKCRTVPVTVPYDYSLG